MYKDGDIVKILKENLIGVIIGDSGAGLSVSTSLGGRNVKPNELDFLRIGSRVLVQEQNGYYRFILQKELAKYLNKRT